jgi:peroxiredoxin
MNSAGLPKETLQNMPTNIGKNVLEISAQQPVMLIFLRHFGCTFCREALVDISKKRKSIEESGFSIVFVHMSDRETAESYFKKYHLLNAIHVSDPDCKFYQSFGLTKGTFTQLFGLSTWIRGFESSVLKGNGVGPFIGDGFQMPGVFVITDGTIRESFIHKIVSDRPDYEDLLQCCVDNN